jgi:hypothetical protein
MLPRGFGLRRTSVSKIHAISADADSVPVCFVVLRSSEESLLAAPLVPPGLLVLHFYPLVWQI